MSSTNAVKHLNDGCVTMQGLVEMYPYSYVIVSGYKSHADCGFLGSGVLFVSSLKDGYDDLAMLKAKTVFQENHPDESIGLVLTTTPLLMRKLMSFRELNSDFKSERYHNMLVELLGEDLSKELINSCQRYH